MNLLTIQLRITRSARLFVILFSLVLSVLPGAAAPRAVLAQDAATKTIPERVHLYIVVDESNSMWSKNDTTSRRIDAVDALIDTLGVLPSINTQATIIMFGDQAKVIAEGSLTTEEGRETLKREVRQAHENLAAEGGMGWTAIDQVWDQVFNEQQKSGSSEVKSAVLLITDGLPETEEANLRIDATGQALQKYLDEVKTTFQQLGNFRYTGSSCTAGNPGSAIGGGMPLYVVGVSEGAEQVSATAAFGNIWQELTVKSGGEYMPLAANASLPEAAIKVLTHLLCLPLVASEENENVVLAPNQQHSVALPASAAVDGIAAVVIKSDSSSENALEPTLTDPTGRTRSTENDATVKVSESAGSTAIGLLPSLNWEGDWRLVITNRSDQDAQIEVLLVPVYSAVRITFHEPAQPTHPRGQEMPIVVRVESNQGVDLSDMLNNVQLSVENSLTGKRDGVEVARAGSEWVGSYLNTSVLNPDDPGDRRIVFSADLQVADQHVPLQKVQPVVLRPEAWLQVNAPTKDMVYAQNQQIPLSVQILVDTKPDMQLAQTAAIMADVQDAAGRSVWSGQLGFTPEQGPSTFVSSIPANLLGLGTHTVRYTLTGTGLTVTSIGRQFEVGTPPPPTPTLIPTPTLPPPPTPTPQPPWDFAKFSRENPWIWQVPAGLLLLGVLFVSGAWLRSRPTLNGMSLLFSQDNSETELHGGWLRPYQLSAGMTTKGDSAATLSLRPRRTSAQEIVAEATVKKLGPGISGVRVGEHEASSTEYSLGQSFEWNDQTSIFVGGEQVTLSNLNQVQS